MAHLWSRPLRVIALGWLLISGGPGAPGGLARVSARDAPAPVAFTFAWPQGLSATVRFHREKGPPQGRKEAIAATWVLEAQRVGGGLRIVTTGTKWTPPPSSQHALDIARGVERVAPILSRDGQVRRVEGLEELDRLLGADVERRHVSSADAARMVQLGHLAMDQEVRELWSMLVGAWAGQSFQLGKTWTRTVRAAPSIDPSAEVDFMVTSVVARRVLCRRGERQARCVEARYTSDAHPGDIAAVLRRSGAPEEIVRDVTLGSEAVVVTDPQTLVPRSLVLTKRGRLPVRRGAGWVMDEWVDRSEYRYHCRSSGD